MFGEHLSHALHLNSRIEFAINYVKPCKPHKNLQIVASLATKLAEIVMSEIINLKTINLEPSFLSLKFFGGQRKNGIE